MKSGSAVLFIVASLLYPSQSESCKASDLNLTYSKAEAYSTGYHVTSDTQLQRVCECTSIDYLLLSCPTCTQSTLDACKLESITGQSNGVPPPGPPGGGYSLDIKNIPLISSLRGLSRLSGELRKALRITETGLTSLDGLDGLTEICTSCDYQGADIPLEITTNRQLISASGLSKIKRNHRWFWITVNFKLACAPEEWGGVDMYGTYIRHGRCLEWTQRPLVADEGNEVKSLSSATSDVCKAACEADAACHSFSFNSEKARCHLKDKCVNADDPSDHNSNHRGYVTHYKPCTSFSVV